jgi:hypothetical protein
MAAAFAFASFWAFIAIVSVVGIVYDYRKKHLAVETLRYALEHGHHVDPALLDRLLSQQKHAEMQEREIDPRHLKIGGIITVATGVGVVILAFFIAQVAPLALYPIMGGGVLVACVGIGLLISARVLAHDPPPSLPDRGA